MCGYLARGSEGKGNCLGLHLRERRWWGGVMGSVIVSECKGTG